MQNRYHRQFIKYALCTFIAMAIPLPRLALAATSAKEPAFYENGRYVPSFMAELNHFLRDYRTGDVHPIAPAFFDQLHTLQGLVGSPGEFHVISGYRSTKTNQMLHAYSDGMASHGMDAGGLGYYPGSDFIHIDTSRVRLWGQPEKTA